MISRHFLQDINHLVDMIIWRIISYYSVINYSTISSRIISIQVKAKLINITIIQVYAPTTNYSDN